MGVFDKFKDLVGIEEYDDEEITEEEMQTTSAQLERHKVDNYARPRASSAAPPSSRPPRPPRAGTGPGECPSRPAGGAAGPERPGRSPASGG